MAVIGPLRQTESGSERGDIANDVGRVKTHDAPSGRRSRLLPAKSRRRRPCSGVSSGVGVGQRLGINESGEVAEEHFGGERGDRAHARVCHQPARLRPLRRLRTDLLIELVDVRGEMIEERLQMRPPVGGTWRQRQSRQRRLALATPQARAPSQPVRQRETLQRVLHARPHPHPLIPMH